MHAESVNTTLLIFASTVQPTVLFALQVRSVWFAPKAPFCSMRLVFHLVYLAQQVQSPHLYISIPTSQLISAKIVVKFMLFAKAVLLLCAQTVQLATF